jgi:hypothetical protein
LRPSGPQLRRNTGGLDPSRAKSRMTGESEPIPKSLFLDHPFQVPASSRARLVAPTLHHAFHSSRTRNQRMTLTFG